MRILTVRQPWAWAIIHGGKTVENRLGNIAGRYRGPVAIHASLTFDPYAVGDPTLLQALSDRAPADEDLEVLGHIIGVVDLIGSHRALGWNPGEVNQCGPSGMCSPWARREQWHLEMVRPRPLLEAIPYQGALGLRDLPAGVVSAIEAVL